jgi:hypothetical protein
MSGRGRADTGNTKTQGPNTRAGSYSGNEETNKIKYYTTHFFVQTILFQIGVTRQREAELN